MDIFVQRIFEKIINYKVCPKRFQILKEKYGRMLKNYQTRPLYTLSSYMQSLVTSELSWSYENLIASLDNLTIESIGNLEKTLFSSFNVEAFFHGNLSKNTALELCNVFENTFIAHYKTIPLLGHPHSNLREVVLEPGANYRYEAIIDIQKPKAINSYFQVSFDNLEDASKLQLINQLLSESFFDILRTKEQLGYVVYNKFNQASGVCGLCFVIQSEYSTSYLDDRIEAFIAWAEVSFKIYKLVYKLCFCLF